MYTRRNILKTDPYVNFLGQTIELGDPVYYICSGYNHSLKMKTGIYSGVLYTVFYDNKEYLHGVKLSGVTRSVFKKKDDGKYGYVEFEGVTYLPKGRIFLKTTELSDLQKAFEKGI